MCNMEVGPIMQIDLTSKVLRKDNVLTHLNQLIDKGYDHERVNEEVEGMTVVTSYSKAGKHTYKTKKIDFTKSVNDTFERDKGGAISFKDYFQ